MTAPKGYVQHDEVIDVPKGTGIEGFLRSIREVLKLPNIQEIRITNRGKVEYTFFLPEGAEKRVVTMNFETLMPMAIIRNAEVQEVASTDSDALLAVMQMFRQAAIDHLEPIGFIAGANSTFWKWIEASTRREYDVRSSLYGLPVHVDRSCPDEVLLLCTAFKKDSELVDMKKAYKISFPTV